MKASKKKLKKIGVLGGTFDPPHNGHLEISKFVLKKLKLSKLIWAVTKKNPLKKKPYFSIKKRISYSKKITAKITKIKVKSFDDSIKSSKTIKLIQHIKNSNRETKIFFIMGSDNLINFNRWHKWKKIAELCEIIVFPRPGYIKKTLKCRAFKSLGREKVKIVKFKKINISSSKIRKSYLRYKN